MQLLLFYYDFFYNDTLSDSTIYFCKQAILRKKISKKMIISFYKNHSNKLILTFSAISITSAIANPTVKSLSQLNLVTSKSLTDQPRLELASKQKTELINFYPSFWHFVRVLSIV